MSNQTAYLDDPQLARAALAPLLAGDLAAWRGLPKLRAAALVAALGEPVLREAAQLGWHPADRWVIQPAGVSGELVAFVRDGEVLMVEVAPPPSPDLEALETPCAILPHEILREGAYVHEYLYCSRGLVLSVAEPFDQSLVRSIVRCRGIRPIEKPELFGPELYCAFEDRKSWS
jgi:hypothetical protein